MYLHGTSKINDKGHLEIGGVDTTQIAERFGTPTFVYDVALIRERAYAFLNAFKAHGVKAQVAYASKAFSCVGMVQLVDELGLSLDVVSGGELYTALRAGIPARRIHFHGNNKGQEELELAIKSGIGCIVVDNFYEIHLIKEVAKKYNAVVPVLLRITPGIEAHTHEYISTGQEDSKFGFDLLCGQAEEAIQVVTDDPSFRMLGFHCHIGSQIFETIGFTLTVEKVFTYLAQWKDRLDYVPEVLNLGGGFGIRYTEEDTPLPVSAYIEATIVAVKEQAEKINIPFPEIWIEPGRSLVGDAGTTLYTVGSAKGIPGVRNYLSVDGGMTDNIRPALYQAKYDAALANRANESSSETYSIAGKCCESGDMLIWDLPLPSAKAGDLLAVFCTGAYGYSMANNYNRITRPAVVFVENGKVTEVIKRETYEDLVRLDLSIRATGQN